jgi:Mor family transcriptional regulator
MSSSKSKNGSTRSRLTLKQKYDLIKDHEDKMDIERLKLKYNCVQSTVYKISKKSD